MKDFSLGTHGQHAFFFCSIYMHMVEEGILFYISTMTAKWWRERHLLGFKGHRHAQTYTLSGFIKAHHHTAKGGCSFGVWSLTKSAGARDGKVQEKKMLTCCHRTTSAATATTIKGGAAGITNLQTITYVNTTTATQFPDPKNPSLTTNPNLKPNPNPKWNRNLNLIPSLKFLEAREP